MGKQRARQLVIEQQNAKDWDVARSATRAAADDVHVRGIGFRRLQVISCPSFDKSRAWEVRQLDDKWSLYESNVAESWPMIQLVGYNLVSNSSTVFASLFSRLAALTIPLSPDLSGMGGLDGTMTQLSIFGDLYSAWRFQWWSQSPVLWKPLVELANEMIDTFSEMSQQNA